MLFQVKDCMYSESSSQGNMILWGNSRFSQLGKGVLVSEGQTGILLGKNHNRENAGKPLRQNKQRTEKGNTMVQEMQKDRP